jgi:transposase
MNYGIDLHPTSFTIAFRDEKNKIRTKYFYMKKLEDFKKMLKPDDIIAIESTSNTNWFYDELKPLVKEVEVVNTIKFKVIAEAAAKTDKLDAKAILEFLEKDFLPTIRVASKPIQKLRSLFSIYLLTRRNSTSYKNRIHSLLKGNGLFLKSKDVFSKAGILELRTLQLHPEDQFQLDTLLVSVEHYANQLDEIQKQIFSFSVLFPKEVHLLMQIPGIGLFIALAIISDIEDIKFFQNERKLCSYLGIVPKVKESNGKRRDGRMTKAGRKTTRSFLSNAIYIWINSSEMYKEFYDRKSKEKGKGKALVALMRKLIVVIYHMLKNGENYNAVNKKKHEVKLKYWLKQIDYFRSLNKAEIDKLETKIRWKYDLQYQQEIKEKIEKNKLCA